jgi:hypothetical protein
MQYNTPMEKGQTYSMRLLHEELRKRYPETKPLYFDVENKCWVSFHKEQEEGIIKFINSNDNAVQIFPFKKLCWDEDRLVSQYLLRDESKSLLK